MERLEGEGVFRCRRCRVDAASKDAIISRDFYGRTGRAYLFDHVYVLCRLPFSFASSRGNGGRWPVGIRLVVQLYCK